MVGKKYYYRDTDVPESQLEMGIKEMADNERIKRDVLNRMNPKHDARRYCPSCGSDDIIQDPEEHAWGYTDFGCLDCRHRWAVRNRQMK